MDAFNRTNSFGLEYMFTEISDNQTLVKCKQKPGVVFVFGANIHTVRQGWYDWMMKGMRIQDAFPTLDVEEREFLKTGITPKEWADIFAEEGME